MNTNEIKNTNTTNTKENAAVQENTAAQSNTTNMTSETLYSEIPPISVEGADANDGISVMCVGGGNDCHDPDCTCPECNYVKPAAPSISLNESTNYITWSAVDGATGYILYAYDTKNKETMTMGVYSYVSAFI